MPVIIAKDKEEVIIKLCELIQKTAKESIELNGTFTIGLSGIIDAGFKIYHFHYE